MTWVLSVFLDQLMSLWFWIKPFNDLFFQQPTDLKKSFECNLCQRRILDQFEFFQHLQSHYQTKDKDNGEGKKFNSEKLHDLKSEVTPILLWFQISFIFSEDISGGREASDQVNPTSDQRSDSTGNTVTAQTRGKPTVAASTKTTRSGRVSKPRSRDLDMVPAFPLNSDYRPEVCALRNQN